MSVSKALRFEVLRRDKFTCRYCGRSGSESELHVDHVHPQTMGGRETLENLVTACKDCNVGKAGLLDVAIRGLIQKPLPDPDDDPDAEVIARFELPPLDLEEQLQRVYEHDDTWCSDGVGRKTFLNQLGLSKEHISGRPFEDGRVDQQERWFKEILAKLPSRERWVVERRTGLWSGRFYSQKWADIGGELGESASHARELYNRGILRLKRMLGTADD